MNYLIETKIEIGELDQNGVSLRVGDIGYYNDVIMKICLSKDRGIFLYNEEEDYEVIFGNISFYNFTKIEENTKDLNKQNPWYENDNNFPCLIQSRVLNQMKVWVHYCDMGIAYDTRDNGYDVAKGNYIMVTDDELDNLKKDLK